MIGAILLQFSIYNLNSWQHERLCVVCVLMTPELYSQKCRPMQLMLRGGSMPCLGRNGGSYLLSFYLIQQCAFVADVQLLSGL